MLDLVAGSLESYPALHQRHCQEIGKTWSLPHGIWENGIHCWNPSRCWTLPLNDEIDVSSIYDELQADKTALVRHHESQ